MWAGPRSRCRKDESRPVRRSELMWSILRLWVESVCRVFDQRGVRVEEEDHLSLEERRREEQRAVREGGGGEAEGFEEAEKELIEHASHGDSGPDPTHLQGRPEEWDGGSFGEADHEESSENQDED